MASHSGYGQARWDAPGPRTGRAEHGGPAPPLCRKGRVDSNDVYGCGSRFSNAPNDTDKSEPYPNDIELSDDDDDSFSSPPSNPHDHFHLDLPSTHGRTTFLGSSSAAGTPEHERYLKPGPYLSPEEYKRFQQNRKTHSNYSGSSGVQSNRSSERQYLSARNCPPSVTSFNESHGHSEADDGAPSSHYYTPSHTTPSHHSRGTIEDIENEVSNKDPRSNERFGRNALYDH